MEAKEPYEKPELVIIDLEAEEVLAVGCKTNGRLARGVFGPLPNCGTSAGCNQRGS